MQKKSYFNRKICSFVAMMLIFGTSVSYSQKKLGCGTFRKPNSHASVGNSQTYSDRFGNLYSEDELNAEVLGKGLQTCDAGYFHIVFNEKSTGTIVPAYPFSTDERDIICKVFSDISTLIVAKNPDTKVVIVLSKSHNLANGNNPLQNDDEVITAAVGTGYYKENCGIANSSAMQVITTGLPYSARNHGAIKLNKDIKWYTGQSLPVPADMYDLYTIVYHEAMHILGMESYIKDPQNTFYTTWDYYLKTNNPANSSLLEFDKSGKCCDAHSINSNVPFSTFKDKGCQQIPDVFFQAGTKVPIALLSYDNSYSDALSHLCNDKVDYLMGLDFPIGKRRTITDEEKSILCTLGYNTAACTANECNPVAVQTGPFIVKPSETIKLSIKDLALNASAQNTLSVISTTPNTGLTVSVVNNEIVCIAGTKKGEYKVKYTIEGCKSEHLCDKGEISVIITDVNIDKDCGKDPCELVQVGDFEIFSGNEEMRYFLSAKRNGFAYDYVTPFAENSADLLDANAPISTLWYCPKADPNGATIKTPSNTPSGTGSKFLGIAVRNIGGENVPEGVTFPLCRAIKPGQTATISFFAAGYNNCVEPQIELNLMASTPLSTYDINANPTVKIGPLHIPLIKLSAYNIATPIPYTQYQQVVTNNTSEDLTHLSLSTFTVVPNTTISTNQNSANYLGGYGYGYVYVDDVSVRLKDPCVITPPTPTYSTCLPDKPDPTRDLIWGKPNTTTAINLLYLPPVTFFQANTITVYGRIQLTYGVIKNTTFYMEPGSEIYIPGDHYVTFDNCKFYGCTQMWKGINVDIDASLTFTNNRIEDAQWAIKGDLYSFLEVNNNVFHNNYYGLHLNGSDFFSKGSTNNTFSGDDKLKPYYTGQDKFTFATVKRSLAGIYIDGMYFVKFEKDVFKNLQIGVLAKNSNFRVSFSNFNDMVGVPGPYFFQTGIGSYNSDCLIYQCDFDNCPKGIEVFGSPTGVTIQENRFKNVDNYAVHVRQTHARVWIEGNEIALNASTSSKPGNFGIATALISGDDDNILYIRSNLIVADDNNTADGIRVLFCDDDAIKGHIYKNTITGSVLSGHDTRKAIYLNQALRMQVDNNYISDNFNGIVLENASQNLVLDNTVKNLKLDNRDGISINEGTNNLLCCNIIEGKNNGLHFTGNCESLDGINTTQLDRYKFGIHYEDETFTDVQDHRGNYFNDKKGIDAQYEDTNGNGDFSLSQYFCHPNNMPDNVNPANWFIPGTGAEIKQCSDIEKCTNVKIFHKSRLDSVIIDRSSDPQYYEKTSQWHGEMYLYDKLYQYPNETAQDKFLTAFYESKSQGEVGKIYDLREKIRANVMTAGFASEYKGVNEKINAFQEEFQKLLKQKQEKGTKEFDASIADYKKQISALVAQKTSMEKSLSEAENAKWKEVATLNGNLKTQRLAAQTEQEVNALNAVYHLNKEILSKEQLDKLYKIAVLCPQISGSSVFTARGLYEIINQNVVDWKAIEKCKNVVISPVETKVSKQNTEIHANVFPNPSHDVLSINIQNAKTFDGEAVLYNLQGQEVYRKAIRIANTFDISTLSNGVYVLHINQNGLSIQTEKLTIIK